MIYLIIFREPAEAYLYKLQKLRKSKPVASRTHAKVYANFYFEFCSFDFVLFVLFVAELSWIRRFKQFL